MDTQMLIAALIFIIPMCFTPGPNNILCAAHGSQHGFRNTLPLIMGMAIGWSALGLFVGGATEFIEKNQSFFDALTVVGALYIAYLGYKVWQSSPSTGAEISSPSSLAASQVVQAQAYAAGTVNAVAIKAPRLGIKTGSIIQLVNGKAWIHFLVLMTQFGSIFGTTFAAKATLVFINLVFGLPAVMSWAAFGTQLRKLFSTPKSAKILNRIMGSSLVAVAIWIAV